MSPVVVGAVVGVVAVAILVRYVRLRTALTDSKHMSAEWMRSNRPRGGAR